MHAYFYLTGKARRLAEPSILTCALRAFALAFVSCLPRGYPRVAGLYQTGPAAFAVSERPHAYSAVSAWGLAAGGGAPLSSVPGISFALPGRVPKATMKLWAGGRRLTAFAP